MKNKKPTTFFLSLAFAFVLSLLAGIGVYGISSLKQIDDSLGVITDDLMIRHDLAMTMRRTARERILHLHRIVLSDDPFEQDSEWMQFKEEASNFMLARNALREMGMSGEEERNFTEQNLVIQENVYYLQQVVDLAIAGKKSEAIEVLNGMALPVQERVFLHIQSQLDLYDRKLKAARVQAKETYQRLISVGWLAGGLALFVGLWVAAWSVRRIGRDQRELLAKEREQSEIIDGMMTGVMAINEQGVIEGFNRAATEIFGYRAEEVVGQSMNMLIPEEIRAGHDAFLQHYFEHEDVSDYMGEREISAVRADGSSFPLRIMLSKIPHGEGGRKRVIASCFDISELKEQEQRLRSSQKMDALGKLTGGIAHDYNNMLAVILGYSELLKMRVAKDDSLRNYVDEIHQAAERGSRLTSKLLSFTRRKPIEESVVDINALLLDDKMMLEKTLTAAVSLQLQLDDGLCVASLDHDDLENAILNIAINAHHAMPDGGVLSISTKKIMVSETQAIRRGLIPGEYVELSIADTGIGMDEETLGRIFEPFFSTKGENGTGLGMSQVYGFVQRSGGDVSVTSIPGKGTRFVLLFPCNPGLPEAQSIDRQEEEKVVATAGGTILVVDDETALCSMAAEMLQAAGYRVLTAAGGEEALNVLQYESVDLLLSDVIMPGMNGYQLAAEVQRRFPSVAIQMMSGYSDSIDSSEVDPLLSGEVLSKPFSAEVLRERIAQLLA